jgi:hypothetical protein
MAPPASAEISAIRGSDTGMRPSTVAITSLLFLRLVILTLVPKDILEWARVKPFFDLLYEALPVWVWAKQGLKKNKPRVSAAINNLAPKGEVCCSLAVVRLRGSYLNNALKGGV